MENHLLREIGHIHTHTHTHEIAYTLRNIFESAARATAMKRGEKDGWGLLGWNGFRRSRAELSMYQPHSVALNRFYVKTALTRGGRMNLKWPCLAARHTLSTHNSPPQK